ncbi:MAG: 3D domain-containing protein [Proteobacteria bacterium]|nr:3D domain-containing protein [Pseudomonadota bacterium]MBU1708413.1 3D domain-containing protein [Pseudomonadota bacterium]
MSSQNSLALPSRTYPPTLFNSFLDYASLLIILAILLLQSGCAVPVSKRIETTAYCGCGSCCDWERGSWKYLKLDFWNEYVSKGRSKGKPYTGKTSSGTSPREPNPGLFSMDSLQRPWMIPVRIIFPWLILPYDGTIAADTNYYPFGTRMHVPRYGWGTVEDRGGAIKGPTRIDLYFDSHGRALQWGRKTVPVRIYKK